MGQQQPRREKPSIDPLGETVADLPSPVDQPAPTPRPAPPSRHRQEPEDIQLADAPSQRARDAANTDVDLTSIFDRTAPAEAAANLSRDDPEAEILRRRTQAAAASAAPRINPKAALLSPFGQLILSIVLALVGLTLAIMASIERTRTLLIAAGVVVPVTAWLTWRRYQQWLGHRRYMYRLLETLGEDVTDFHPSKSIRAVKVRKS
jgi:hypothetical protein